jgi:RHS repeat-associated protein
MAYTSGGITETTYYIGRGLEKVLIGANYEFRHYIVGATGTAAVYTRKSSGSVTTTYVLRDHQDSIESLISSAGTAIAQESFTAFGSRRNAATWTGVSPDRAVLDGITRRGYTGQTVIGAMGLNHMNGRVQDSVTGRFLSPDPYVPDVGSSQPYNRYTYVINNPLSFVDPSGFAYAVPSGEPGCFDVYEDNSGGQTGPDTVEVIGGSYVGGFCVPDNSDIERLLRKDNPGEGGSPQGKQNWVCSKQGKAVISSAVGGAVTTGIYSGGNPLAIVAGAAVGGSIGYAANRLESYPNASPVVQGIIGAADSSPRAGGVSSLLTGGLVSGGVPEPNAAAIGGAFYGGIEAGLGPNLLPGVVKGGVAGGLGALAAEGTSDFLDWACTP